MPDVKSVFSSSRLVTVALVLGVIFALRKWAPDTGNKILNPTPAAKS